MKIAIIINAYTTSDKELNQPLRLKEELTAMGVSVDIVRNDNFACSIAGSDIACAYCDYDGVVYLDKDKYLSCMLDKLGVRLFNPHHAVRVCDDKMSTHIALSNYGIPMPSTLAAPLCYTEGATPSDNYIDTIGAKLGYPLVVKECYGSLGKGVKLAKNRGDLLAIAKSLINTPHLYQQFVAPSCGRDVRVIVIGGRVIASMLRCNTSDFRSNIELGGVGTPYTASQGIIDLAEKVAGVIGLDYCGIDMLLGEGDNPIVCEVNSNAFFGGIEKVCNINVAKIYAEHIVLSLTK